MSLNKTLSIHTSPHIVKGISTDVIMRNVVWALIPISAFSVYAFGISALLVLVTAVVSSVLAEHLFCKITNTETTISDWSATITGLLFGLTLPPNFPLWMVFSGGFIAIGLGKFIFGGLGYNVFNPALVGRAVLQAAFPVAITTWYPAFTADRFTTLSSSTFTFPFATPVYDTVSGATPLSAFKFDKIAADSMDLVMGLTSGSIGETSAILILLGGLYLIYRNMMNWRIPVSMLGSVFIISGLLHLFNDQLYASPLFMLFSGGLMLGAVFMATDMVASPITPLGCWVYGAIIGTLIIVIRTWGGLPEGVMYAILLGNAISPHIDNLIRPRVYGTGKNRGQA
ncbi:MAG: RnfABCDGE type electron transport complex subunit D [Calditrichaeota bacterium]|nr:MAG: RnfABCDGE type electron transport complex subunit D [Calditrichota bacterium]MBL1206638.1 RnfABCDGE type electron transport complex subunit D [Calditrichota bacterium]NOG46465.1 RnfABCDGE type electron transport complex subunit D [Calditrichota bacterium]